MASELTSSSNVLDSLSADERNALLALLAERSLAGEGSARAGKAANRGSIASSWAGIQLFFKTALTRR
jgi:hypothetical protein